jgi:hypothetical protein
MEALVLYVHKVITTPPNDACDVIDTADTMSAVREQSAVICTLCTLRISNI